METDMRTCEDFVRGRSLAMSPSEAIIRYIDNVLIPDITDSLSRYEDKTFEPSDCDDCEDWALRCDFLQEQYDEKLEVIQGMEKVIEKQNALISRLQEEVQVMRQGDHITQHLGVTVPDGD
jgi:hypothetical protein